MTYGNSQETENQPFEIARREARPRLDDMSAWFNHVIVGDFAFGRNTRRWISLVFLFTAVIIGCLDYVREGLIWDTIVSLRPDLFSGTISILLVSALYVRRILELAQSVYFYLSIALNLTITAILVQALLGKAAPAFSALPMPYILGFAIAMTWIGIRPAAPIVWGLVFVFGLTNLHFASDAMGIWGFGFILFAALGFVLQFEPNMQDFMHELRYDFIGDPNVPRALRRHTKPAHDTGGREIEGWSDGA